MKAFKRTEWLLLAAAGLFMSAWFTGVIGSGAARILQTQLPWRADREFRIDHFYYTNAVPDDNGRIFIAISESRIKNIMDEAAPYAVFIPPGLIRNGLVVEAAWLPRGKNRMTGKRQPMGVEIPVGLVVRDTNGDHPRMTGRLHADLLTDYINGEFARDLREDREEWELGHFAYDIRPSINFCSLRTTNDASLSPEAYAKKLYVMLMAQGDMKLKLEENIGSVERDGHLSFRLDAEVYFEEMEDGLCLRYDAFLRRMDGNIKGANNIIDDYVSSRLKEKWQKSLNREKRKKRLEERLLPSWFPTDLVINLTFDRE